jgi:hypothetical protein
VSRSTETVLYRDGREVVGSDAGKGKKSQPAAQGLTTQGLFGTILGTVLVDAGQGNLAWDHWEQGADGPQAVFHYTVPVLNSLLSFRVFWQRINGESFSLPCSYSRFIQMKSNLMAAIETFPKFYVTADPASAKMGMLTT